MKLYELAKELNITNKIAKEALQVIELPIKSHVSNISDEQEVALREYVENMDIELADTEPQEMTRPWDASDNPFALDMLKLKKKHEGFRPRWVSPSNVQKKLDQGWKFADRKDYDGVTDTVIGDEGTSQDGTLVKRREMILMEIPEELAQKRADYIDYKTNRRSIEMSKALAEKMNKEIKDATGESPEMTAKFVTSRANR